jgi:hypothetical protein
MKLDEREEGIVRHVPGVRRGGVGAATPSRRCDARKSRPFVTTTRPSASAGSRWLSVERLPSGSSLG